jgi:hypothetical protein
MLLKSVGGSSLQHPSTEKLARKSRRRRRRWWHAIIYFGWLVPKCHPMASYCSLVSYTPIELSIWKKSFFVFDCYKNVRNLQIGNTKLINSTATIDNKNYIFFIKKLKLFFFFCKNENVTENQLSASLGHDDWDEASFLWFDR